MTTKTIATYTALVNYFGIGNTISTFDLHNKLDQIENACTIDTLKRNGLLAYEYVYRIVRDELNEQELLEILEPELTDVDDEYEPAEIEYDAEKGVYYTECLDSYVVYHLVEKEL
jgi:hypothetical protein